MAYIVHNKKDNVKFFQILSHSIIRTNQALAGHLGVELNQNSGPIN